VEQRERRGDIWHGVKGSPWGEREGAAWVLGEGNGCEIKSGSPGDKSQRWGATPRTFLLWVGSVGGEELVNTEVSRCITTQGQLAHY